MFICACYTRKAMTHDEREIEDKYSVDDDVEMPALDRLPGVATVRAVEVRELEATYFDTAELTLAQAGISLRRRTGARMLGGT